jgi:cysteine desulfurase
VLLNGHPTDRLPNTLNVSILGVRGRQLLAEVDRAARLLAARVGAGHPATGPAVSA